MNKTEITFAERLLTGFFSGLIVFLIDGFGPLGLLLEAGGIGETFSVCAGFHV